MARKDVEKACDLFPDLLNAAENGLTTIITRNWHAVAALVPIGAYEYRGRQQSLLPLVGSGRGLWGRNSAATIAKLRDEWAR